MAWLLSIVAVSYALVYGFLLKADRTFFINDSQGYEMRSLSYHIDSPIVDTIFAPAYWLDRKIRPDYWVREVGQLYWPTGKKFNLKEEAAKMAPTD
jgi:hypothetical protein